MKNFHSQKGKRLSILYDDVMTKIMHFGLKIGVYPLKSYVPHLLILSAGGGSQFFKTFYLESITKDIHSILAKLFGQPNISISPSLCLIKR